MKLSVYKLDGLGNEPRHAIELILASKQKRKEQKMSPWPVL